MKSYEKLLLCPCGQNHLRWSCLSISFNFLSEFGFNWTIDHNEDFNRQSRDWVRRAGGAGDWLLQLWLRSGLWLLTWVGCGPAKSIRTSFCRSGSSVLSIVWKSEVWRYISLEIKSTDRFSNLLTGWWLHVVNIFLPETRLLRRKGRKILVTAKSGAFGCDNYRGPGPGVCLRPGSCYTVVTWHCATLSRCHEHGVTVFITWSRQ